MNLKIDQQKISKPKYTEIKELKQNNTEQNIQELWDSCKTPKAEVIGKLEEKKDKK